MNRSILEAIVGIYCPIYWGNLVGGNTYLITIMANILCQTPNISLTETFRMVGKMSLSWNITSNVLQLINFPRNFNFCNALFFGLQTSYIFDLCLHPKSSLSLTKQGYDMTSVCWTVGLLSYVIIKWRSLLITKQAHFVGCPNTLPNATPPTGKIHPIQQNCRHYLTSHAIWMPFRI